MRRGLLILVLSVWVSGCSAALAPLAVPARAIASIGDGAAPVRMHVQQRGLCDCAIASIAMLTGSLYEVVEIQVPPAWLEGTPLTGCGISTLDAVSIAAKMGVTVRYIDDDEVIAEQVDPSRHEGALVLTWPNGLHHMVFVAEGRVYDPLRQWPMKWEDYRKMERFKIGVFLYRVGRFALE